MSVNVVNWSGKATKKIGRQEKIWLGIKVLTLGYDTREYECEDAKCVAKRQRELALLCYNFRIFGP